MISIIGYSLFIIGSAAYTTNFVLSTKKFSSKTQAKVLDIKSEYKNSFNGQRSVNTEYRIVTVEFMVHNKTYQSSFQVEPLSVDRLKKYDIISIYYDPNEPNNFVRKDNFVLVFSGIVGLIALTGLVYTLTTKEKQNFIS